MTDDEARDAVCKVLHKIAPDADLDDVSPEQTLQESLGLDSLDFLRFVAGLHQLTGVEIPDQDYSRLLTIEACVDYLASDPTR